MITLTALKPVTYGPRRFRPGDTFAAQDAHARLLVAVGRAMVAESLPAAEPARMAADEAQIATDAPAAPAEAAAPIKPRARRYRRRDLTPETET